MVGDYWGERLPLKHPWIYPDSPTTVPNIIINPSPSQEEFDALKREVEILKELLFKAKEYDRRNNEPDCEIDAKMQKLKDIAKIVGIDLDEVLRK